MPVPAWPAHTLRTQSAESSEVTAGLEEDLGGKGIGFFQWLTNPVARAREQGLPITAFDIWDDDYGRHGDWYTTSRGSSRLSMR